MNRHVNNHFFVLSHSSTLLTFFLISKEFSLFIFRLQTDIKVTTSQPIKIHLSYMANKNALRHNYVATKKLRPVCAVLQADLESHSLPRASMGLGLPKVQKATSIMITSPCKEYS